MPDNASGFAPDTKETPMSLEALTAQARTLHAGLVEFQASLQTAAQVPGASYRLKEFAGWVGRLANRDLQRISAGLEEVASGVSPITDSPEAFASVNTQDASALPRLQENQECIKLFPSNQKNQILAALRYIGAQSGVHFLQQKNAEGLPFLILPKALAENGMLTPLIKDSSGKFKGDDYCLTAQDVGGALRIARGDDFEPSR